MKKLLLSLFISMGVISFSNAAYYQPGDNMEPESPLTAGKKKRTKRVIHEYEYDERGRLVKVLENKELVEEYRYDANGNREWAKVYGVVSEGQYTLDDQIVVYGDNTYRYDEDGFLYEKNTPEGTTTYLYGTRGELIQVITPEKNIVYYLNANNQRVAKAVDGVVVEKYLWKDLTTLLAVYDGNDNLIQRYEYAEGRMPLSMTYFGKKFYLHYDQVGTLRVISNTDYMIMKEIEYDSFGNILYDSNELFYAPFRFGGGLYDADTGLIRFGYRDYDSYTGKWTAKDPIGFEGGDSNLYGYVLGDPVNFIDPNGLFYSPTLEHRTYITDGQCMKSCLGEYSGIDFGLGLGLTLGSLPILSTRGKTSGATRGTSPISSGLSKALPYKLPFKVPTPTNAGMNIKTNNLGRALGRWAPLGGWGALGFSTGHILSCIDKCTEEKCEK